MNKTLLFASLFSLGLTFASAQSGAQIVSSTTTLTRQNYEDKNSQDLRELRREVDAVYEQTPLAGQTALAPYRDAVAAAEQALADYKIASDLDLPARKSDLEAAKANAVRLWSDYRKSHFPAAPAVSGNGGVSDSAR